MADEAAEYTLLALPQCFVFRIPPASSSAGHMAASWPKEPLWTGRLRIVSRETADGEQCLILLEHSDKEGLFAACRVPSDAEQTQTVEPVKDSSRYFVLRMEDGKGSHAFIGLGFNSRDAAFDFKVAIRDYQKQAEAKCAQEPLSDRPVQDFKLKGTVKLGTKINKAPKKGSKPSSSTSLALSPPPAKGKPRSKKASQQTRQTEELDFDDFLGVEPATTKKPAKNEDWSMFDGM